MHFSGFNVSTNCIQSGCKQINMLNEVGRNLSSAGHLSLIKPSSLTCVIAETSEVLKHFSVCVCVCVRERERERERDMRSQTKPKWKARQLNPNTRTISISWFLLYWNCSISVKWDCLMSEPWACFEPGGMKNWIWSSNTGLLWAF